MPANLQMMGSEHSTVSRNLNWIKYLASKAGTAGAARGAARDGAAEGVGEAAAQAAPACGATPEIHIRSGPAVDPEILRQESLAARGETPRGIESGEARRDDWASQESAP